MAAFCHRCSVITVSRTHRRNSEGAPPLMWAGAGGGGGGGAKVPAMPASEPSTPDVHHELATASRVHSATEMHSSVSSPSPPLPPVAAGCSGV